MINRFCFGGGDDDDSYDDDVTAALSILYPLARAVDGGIEEIKLVQQPNRVVIQFCLIKRKTNADEMQ